MLTFGQESCPIAQNERDKVLKVVLNILGWIAIISGIFNGSLRLLGLPEIVAAYAGSTRNLDMPITFVVFGLILISLATIIARLDKLLEIEWVTEEDE
jgi:uncharacterized membrane protein YedE/YeeE|tara:strand:+ start:358 stop:651 length:294 start_codon:yes stop_codon:yes gene_type:complete